MSIPVLLGSIVLVACVVISHAEPILRTRVIETLSTRFKSKVELNAFHVSLFQGLQVSGEGLRIFGVTGSNRSQPVIAVAEFRFRTGLRDLFRSPMHVDTVYLKGLQLNLPPKGQRGEMKNFTPQGKKITIDVDRLVADTTELVINTAKPGKLPLVFAIQSLRMARIGPNEPMHFDADLINPKPVGNVHSSGTFGPWQADSPRDTPVSGTYAFSDANLGTIKGIGGILSSTGNYGGTLDHIAVDGSTDTPDFHLAISGKPVPLHTDFHAIVDGTTGDTYLHPVKAKLLNSWLVASGSVVRIELPHGHRVMLDVTIDRGRIEDLLKLAVETTPPVMTGTVRLRTKLDLPPGDIDVASRLTLSGTFRVGGVHFTSENIQGKIDALSRRSSGKLKSAPDERPEDVLSDLSGTFELGDALLSFSQLRFKIPGTQVDLTGQYSLDGNQVDFHGKARMDAKLSQMVGGWKSVLLKAADPFFSKDGAGTEIPVKITGTKSDLHFGTDFHHKRGS